MSKRLTILLGLGSSLSDRCRAPRDIVGAALDRLEALAGLNNFRRSRLYASPAFPPGSGPDFVNAAAAADGDLAPCEMLDLCHEIESVFDRRREGRWTPRTLDVDLLAVGDLVRPDARTQSSWRDLDPARQRQEVPEQLILPHPRLQDRGFVLVPLAEVAPDWTHPVTGLSVGAMRDALPPDALHGVRPLCAR